VGRRAHKGRGAEAHKTPSACPPVLLVPDDRWSSWPCDDVVRLVHPAVLPGGRDSEAELVGGRRPFARRRRGAPTRSPSTDRAGLTAALHRPRPWWPILPQPEPSGCEEQPSLGGGRCGRRGHDLLDEAGDLRGGLRDLTSTDIGEQLFRIVGEQVVRSRGDVRVRAEMVNIQGLADRADEDVEFVGRQFGDVGLPGDRGDLRTAKVRLLPRRAVCRPDVRATARRPAGLPRSRACSLVPGPSIAQYAPDSPGHRSRTAPPAGNRAARFPALQKARSRSPGRPRIAGWPWNGNR
jgi:hypothetical protein